MQNIRGPLVEARRLVVKVGSSLLVDGGRLNVGYIGQLSAQIAEFAEGREFAVVSSGAVAAGMQRLGWRRRPQGREDLQVTAAVGQMGLANAYEDAFDRHNLHVALVLLTAEDMAHRTLYLNARDTLRRMLHHSIVPIINENDVIATADARRLGDTIRFVNNDELAAQIANLLEADALLLLTDVPGVCRNAADFSDVVGEARAADDSLLKYAKEKAEGGVGLGGMRSKLDAARLAARSGTHTLIADGRTANCIGRALAGDAGFGTFLVADMPRLSARKQWLGHPSNVRGVLVLDAGAVRAVVEGKRSLLPVGVQIATGDFIRGDAVRLMSEDAKTVGYALVNYDEETANKICGKNSAEIAKLGYEYEEMAHRDNMVIVR